MKIRGRLFLASLLSASLLCAWIMPALALMPSPGDPWLVSACASEIDIAWTDDVAGEDHWCVYRYIVGDSSPAVQIGYLGANSHAYSDATVTEGITYGYYLCYTSGTDVSCGSGVLTVTAVAPYLPPPPLLVLPIDPSGLHIVGDPVNPLHLAWTDNSVDESPYHVQRKGPGETAFTDLASLPVHSNSYSDAAVTAGGTYCYRVYCTNSAGDSGFSNELTVTVTAPPPALPLVPTNLRLSASTSTRVDLAWNDNATDENAYHIERKGPSDSVFVSYASGGAGMHAYSDSAVNPGATYVYRVCCSNATGRSGYSNELTIVVPSATAGPETGTPPTAGLPAAPTNLTAMAATAAVIDLSWTDNADNETVYYVERKGPGDTDFAVYATVLAGVHNYRDSGIGGRQLQSGALYSYRVRAGNSAGYSAYSNVASATARTSGAASTTVRFYLGSTTYYINGVPHFMDIAPYETEGRTLLPIRYAVEPLGAAVDWSAEDQKVTITMNHRVIELWIDNNTAMVDGVATRIDPGNAGVIPLVMPPGRTMMPLRFITENLGCTVDYNASTQEVTVTYNP